ncbi:MAG: glycosyltransferase family 2 protein [Ignavibacteria bacterium]|jgi:glycosyltransferase involved in cell wall biosynthesis|nr:glycosyltransferase family 2 protein [Ignavibacteria bacterium]
MKIPSISVIMSVYNGEKYIRDAIESILKQIYTNFEFIIINDGSTDDSAKIISSYSDARISLIQQENKGLSLALNRGIYASRGKYIARMDADDISESNRLLEQIQFMEENPEYVAVGTFANYVDDEGNFLYKGSLPIKDTDIRIGLPIKCPFVHSSVMMKADILKKIGGYKNCGRYFYQEDLLLWNDLSFEGSLYNINKYLINYRITPSSNSQRSRKFNAYQMNIVKNYSSTKILDFNKINNIPEEWTFQKDKNRLSFYYKNIGSTYLIKASNKIKAREYYIKSIKSNFFDIKAYVSLLVSYLPIFMIKRLSKVFIQIKNMVKNLLKG